MYDGKYRGNFLVVGRAGFGKTYFVQKLVINNFFGKIVRPEWVSYIQLNKTREVEIQSWFNQELQCHYPKNLEDLDHLLEKFKLRSKNSSNDNPIVRIVIIVMEKI